jgi:methionyl aminopeptidase
MIPIKTNEDIRKLQKSAELLVETFKAVEVFIKPGIQTKQLDAIAFKTIQGGNGIPAFKGYNGYPATVCVSIDQEVVHGIPGDRMLKEGELVSIDIGVSKDGFYSDAAKTYALDPIPLEKRKLMETTRRALFEGIRQCRNGRHLSDVSHAIQISVESQGYSVVRDLVGHGIGKILHEPPQIPNFGPPHRGPRLKPGMVLAIEPMVNMGSEKVRFLEDGWTVVSWDGMPSAHFEHTVLITNGDPEILTIGIDDNSLRSVHG